MSLYIAQVVTGLLPVPPNGWGAIEKIIWAHTQELKSRGHSVNLVSYGDPQPGEYDIVHVHTANQALALRDRGVEYVFTMDDHHAYEHGKDSFVFQQNYEALKCAKRGAVSAEYLVDYFNLPHVAYIPLGVDSNYYTPMSESVDTHLLCVGNNGLAGTLFDRKGFRYAIEAASKLNIPITVAGPRNCNEQFFAQNVDLMTDNLHICYDLTDAELLDLYRSASILVHASSIEGGHPPLTILEAMSCGLPVVGTFMGKDVITPDGLVERDVNSVVLGIGRILSRYAYHREHARKVAQQYSWTKACDKLLVEVYGYRPKVKLVHLLTGADAREPESVASLSQLQDYGIDYVQHISELYTRLPPKENCLRPNDIAAEPGWYKLAPRHYGNFRAFQMGIVDEFTEDVDFLILCESDVVLDTPPDEFARKVFVYGDLITKHEIMYFSLGNNHNWDTKELVSSVVNQISTDAYVTDKIVGTQCIMFPKAIREFVRDCFLHSPWDASDLFLNSVFCPSKYKLGIVTNKLISQVDGLSLIDNKYKTFGPTTKPKMVDELISLYKETPLKVRDVRPQESKLATSFIEGAKFEVLGSMPKEYEVEFFDGNTQQLIYSTVIQTNSWAMPNRKWFTDWYVRARCEGHICYEHKLDLMQQRVFVVLDSRALGDTLAWFPAVERFRLKHNCKLVCSTFHNYLFKQNYPNIEFVEPGSTVHNLYAMYVVGCFDNNSDKNKINWKSVPLMQVAEDFLGLTHEETRPIIHVPKVDVKLERPYVCLSEHSTMNCKYWHYPNAWQSVVDYLRSCGYSVVVIGLEDTRLKQVINKTKIDINETLNILLNSTMYLGVSSGPAWLAWALRVPVLMVSGCTTQANEFTSGITRIINERVCFGCFNDTQLELDRGDWNWCPRKKNFECTRSIKPSVVIEAINRTLAYQK